MTEVNNKVASLQSTVFMVVHCHPTNLHLEIKHFKSLCYNLGAWSFKDMGIYQAGRVSSKCYWLNFVKCRIQCPQSLTLYQGGLKVRVISILIHFLSM